MTASCNDSLVSWPLDVGRSYLGMQRSRLPREELDLDVGSPASAPMVNFSDFLSYLVARINVFRL